VFGIVFFQPIQIALKGNFQSAEIIFGNNKIAHGWQVWKILFDIGEGEERVSGNRRPNNIRVYIFHGYIFGLIVFDDGILFAASKNGFCAAKVAELNLPMKMVDVDLRLDRRKIVFYFTAEDRIDFRELVKLLAAEFKTRIEMRQISSREEMKRTDGMGPCGLQLCCAGFIDDFDPISTQLVKEQNLPMNPAKISGCCGKLKCCYRYEHDLYEEVLKNYPAYGSKVKVTEKNGVLEKIDIFAQTVSIRYEDNTVEDFPLTDFSNSKITVIQ